VSASNHKNSDDRPDDGAHVDAVWVPAFPGQRAPFQPGHELSLQHGAYSPRVIEPVANGIVEQLLADDQVAYLRVPAYRVSLWRYATAQARADLLHAFLIAHGDECQGCERCVGLEERWRILSTTAGKTAQRLGLDPLSRARLGKDVAQGRAADAAAIMAELHRLDLERKQTGEGGDES
jgi:hypothetical protein